MNIQVIGRTSIRAFARVCLFATATVVGVSEAAAQVQGYGYTLPDPNKPPKPPVVLNCRHALECIDDTGQRVRLNKTQSRDNLRTQALITIDCSSRAIGSGPATAEEIICLQRFFGLPEGPLDDVSVSLLDTLRSGDREQNLRFARRLGHAPGGGEAVARISSVVPSDIVRDHPDGALFVHPKQKRVWGAISFGDLQGALSGSRSLPAEARWPDLSAMEGREYSVLGKGVPLFIVRFKSHGGEIESPSGEVYAAAYDGQQGFDCIPGAPVMQGKCFGLAIQAPPGGRGVWRLRPAFRGDQGPVLFGQIAAGRQAFDEAKSEPSSAPKADSAPPAQVPADKLAATLPLNDVEPSVAYYATLIYGAPAAPEAEFASQARIPFLAYHAAYAQVCAQEFDGDPEVWRDFGERLIESSDVPGNRFRIYEEYIRTEMPVQADAYRQFALGMEEWRLGWVFESSRAKNYYPFLADYLAMLDRRFTEWWEGWGQVIAVTGCRGPTVDRLEANLAASHAMIPR